VVLPAACLLVGIGADWLLSDAQRAVPLNGKLWQRASASVVAGLLLVLAALNLSTYYGSFASSCVYVGERGWQASMLGSYLAAAPRDIQAFVLPTADSFRYGPHRSVDYLSGRMAIANIDAPLGATAPVQLEEQRSAGFVAAAVPARQADLDQVARWFPGGERTALTQCGVTLAVYHWRP
jgi:hypothetical protein